MIHYMKVMRQGGTRVLSLGKYIPKEWDLVSVERVDNGKEKANQITVRITNESTPFSASSASRKRDAREYGKASSNGPSGVKGQAMHDSGKSGRVRKKHDMRDDTASSAADAHP